MRTVHSRCHFLLLLFVLSCGPSTSADADGLVGYWPLDEGMGNVAEDLSGKGNAGRILGDVQWEQTERGTALRFNGKNTAVVIPDSPAWNIGRGEMTLCLWIKSALPHGGYTVDHSFDKSRGAWVLQTHGNEPLFSLYDDALHPLDTRFGGFDSGQWQHLVLVWRRTEDGWMKPYVNGAPTRAPLPVTCSTKHFGDLFFGARQGSASFFKGYIKEVTIFNRVLSEEEIQAIYARGVRLKSPVVVSSPKPEKILYQPKDKGSTRVRVRNVSDAVQNVDLVLQLVFRLDDTREVYRAPLELPPKSSTLKNIDFGFANEEYGCELRATVEQDGEILSTASEYFSVSDNLWKVCLGAEIRGPISASANYTEQQISSQMDGFRQRYCNWFEKVFWAPDDWGELTPEPGASWFSGQTRRHENTEKLKLQIDAAHKHGIKAITYGKCMAGGASGWDLARRKPAWFLVDLFGRTMGRPADVWDLDHWHEADKYAGSDFRYVWTYRWVDTRRLDALDHGINELIASAKQFGWDGVRFDSASFSAHFIDGKFRGSDAVNTRNMKRLKERIWKVYPEYLFGNNTGNPAAKDGRGYPLSPEDPITHEVREMLAGGGLWMGEGMRDWDNGGVRYTTWSKFARDEVRCIRTIKHYGGHFCYSYAIGGEPKARDLYKFVIGTMIGAHPYVGAHMKAPGSEDWGRFLTRWSGLFWHHRLRPLEKAEERATVTSRNPLWWKEFANQYVISATRRQVIVNLLNPPVNDAISQTADELPDPARDCAVTLNIPRGQNLTRVFFISPGSPNRAQELKAVMKRGSARVSVPRFDVWAMVVWELEGTFEVPRPVPKYTEPLSGAEKAELERTTPTPMEKTPWFGNVPPAPTPNIAVADNTLNPTPQHDAGIEVRDFGEPTVHMPEGLTAGGEPGLDVLVVKGFYHYAYRVPEAIRAYAPDVRIAECTTRDLPKDYGDLFKHDVIVLVDMGAESWDADGHKGLADFVEAGGTLVVLGGPFTLGQGFYKGTLLENVLPVDVRPARDVYRLPEPLALGPKRSVPFRAKPLLYYYHATKPKNDAQTLLWAGDLPVLLRRKVGKGESLVFIGTVLGKAQEKGEIPFWEWKDWPEILGKAIISRAD